MFKKVLLAAAIAASAALAGCSSTQTASLDTITASIVQGVQETAANLCSIIPEAASVASIFNASIGATVSSVASAICSVAPAPASAEFKALPRFKAAAPVLIGTVNGVPLTGWRTK